MRGFSIGIDFGTETGRVLVVDMNGKIAGTSVVPYKHGVITEKLPINDALNLPKDYALQHPNDYIEIYDKVFQTPYVLLMYPKKIL